MPSTMMEEYGRLVVMRSFKLRFHARTLAVHEARMNELVAISIYEFFKYLLCFRVLSAVDVFIRAMCLID